MLKLAWKASGRACFRWQIFARLFAKRLQMLKVTFSLKCKTKLPFHILESVINYAEFAIKTANENICANNTSLLIQKQNFSKSYNVDVHVAISQKVLFVRNVLKMRYQSFGVRAHVKGRQLRSSAAEQGTTRVTHHHPSLFPLLLATVSVCVCIYIYRYWTEDVNDRMNTRRRNTCNATQIIHSCSAMFDIATCGYPTTDTILNLYTVNTIQLYMY